MISFNCYYPAEQPCLFKIDIDEKKRVCTLMREVGKKLLTQFETRVGLFDMQLFKADVPQHPFHDLPMRALQWLHQHKKHKEDDALVDAYRLSEIFPGGPSSSDVVHIIVSDSEVWEMTENMDNLPYFHQSQKLRKDLQTRRQSLRAVFEPEETINTVTKLREFLDHHRVYLGRPGGAPAAIFNPILAALQRRLENLNKVEVTREDVANATDHLNVAIQIYDDRMDRQSAIRKSINVALNRGGADWGMELEWVGITPDRVWWGGGFLMTVLELKSTVGLPGNPVLQAVVDYCKIISEHQDYQEFCNFPVILLGITENRIDISIAVCIAEIHVTHLLTLDLTAGFLASDNIIRLARVFKALSLCQADLELYYDKAWNKVVDKTLPPFSSLYPNPTPADSSDTLPLLYYTHLLSQAGEPTLVTAGLGDTTTAKYIATLADQEVVVKFTARYNEQVHRLLAEAEFAPKLHLCKRVVGGLYMVVMDRVCGKSLWQLQQDEKPIPTGVLEQVRQAVHLLHENDIVFGDLRDGNVLYDTSKSRAVLVDFDWAGVHGVDRYPPTINVADKFKWSPDVEPYGPMLKDHDLWQLERLQGVFKLDV